MPKKKKEIVTISVRVDKGEAKQLDVMAAASYRSRASQVYVFIREGLARRGGGE